MFLKRFKPKPTDGQQRVMEHLAAFLLSQKTNPLYLLKGFAGTGKTTLVSVLVQVLPQLNMGYVLLAPTGRAAKVLQQYSGKQAATIHRKIYYQRPDSSGLLRMMLAPNKHKHTVFIVDEASMIGDNRPDNSLFGASGLLDDLMAYVQDGEHCRILFIGDHAQLPPVGTDLSPALDLHYLKTTYSLTAASYELTEVMRQSLESGILFNATAIRTKLHADDFGLPLFQLQTFDDVLQVSAEDFEELLQDAFGGRDFGKAVIVCRSNRRANDFNQAVRARILAFEEELSGGDLLMVVKNNYYWMALENAENNAKPQMNGFIANGDMLTVNRINSTENCYGYTFADAEVSFMDYPGQPPMAVKLLLHTLTVDGPAMSAEEQQKLLAAIEADYADIPSRRQRLERVRANPYFNALQVKFGYALTCHKTQGGQWPWVFVDGGSLRPDKLDAAYMRWLYTAVTRATEKLMLVNFPESTIG